MPRRKKQPRSLLPPIADGVVRRLSNADARLRRKIVRYGLWILALAFVYSTMMGDYSVPRIVRLELRRQSLIESNRRLLAELVDKDLTRKRLESDRDFIEHVARTRYHMARPDETIYFYRGR
jgi:cell division protein FtsB